MVRALSTGALLLAGWATAGLAASSGSSGRFSKLQEVMAGKAHMGLDGVVNHVAYSSRTLRKKIHAPVRATQVGGDQMARLLERAQNGGWADHIAMAGEMFQAKELDEVFSNTRAAVLLLENVPMIKLIRGIPEITAKGEAITPQDSANALSLIRAWSAKTVKVMSKLAQDPSTHLAERMATLEDGSNPELLALFEKAGKGDKAAAVEAQRIVAEEELGGLFDFAAMGLDGIEPEMQVNLRKRVMDTPLLASLINDMPKEAVAFATSPMNIAEQAQKMIEAGEI